LQNITGFWLPCRVCAAGLLFQAEYYAAADYLVNRDCLVELRLLLPSNPSAGTKA